LPAPGRWTKNKDITFQEGLPNSIEAFFGLEWRTTLEPSLSSASLCVEGVVSQRCISRCRRFGIREPQVLHWFWRHPRRREAGRNPSRNPCHLNEKAAFRRRMSGLR
ncbi:unnamed protein product, partial [Ectocarpus sp. 6 AP-2014]